MHQGAWHTEENVAYVLKDSIQREVERLFPGEQLEDVLRKLRETKLPMDQGAPPPRVHAAVLLLSKGEVKRFDYELAGADCDWRDTLVSAGLGNADWKQVLNQKGIDCDDW